MTPAAPLVGAVTTRPPAAFSSFTAMRIEADVVHDLMRRAGVAALPRRERSRIALARRLTLRPPGSVPSVASPRSMQAIMVPSTRPICGIDLGRGVARPLVGLDQFGDR